MAYNPDNPIVVQSDRTILLEVRHTKFTLARDFLSSFAELEKSPEYIHSYRITSLSIWNAVARGMKASEIIMKLHEYSKFDVPQNIIREIQDIASRYGRLKLIQKDDGIRLIADTSLLMTEIRHNNKFRPFFLESCSPTEIVIDKKARGRLKQALLKAGYPVEDLAGYKKGQPLAISLRAETLSSKIFTLREYQKQSIDAFYLNGSLRGGNGVIVLPCGAGKTVVGIGVMSEVKAFTLIITTGVIAVRQWIAELLDKTFLTPEMVGEYTGECKEIRPVTITTYQMMTWRKNKESDFVHMELFDKHDWGLIIYDEVHLLPAPVFRATTELQSLRRLGLTATLVREDGCEDDVFSLIGPKRYDVPWHDLERQGWIAPANCYEIRIAMGDELRLNYAIADKRSRFRLAAENSAKISVVDYLLKLHHQERVLIIGQYIKQLKSIANIFNVPLITGQTPNSAREEHYRKFRRGEENILVVSKVANFAIDLPEASVAIQVSGTFGSRQEEAQRLGRLLRPTDNKQAHFYSLVSKDSSEQEFAINRQLFLTEQGYRYYILNVNQLAMLKKAGEAYSDVIE